MEYERRKTCWVEGCEKPTSQRNLCVGHVQQEQAGKPFTPLRPYTKKKSVKACSFPGCEQRGRYTKGLCAPHYTQHMRGLPPAPLMVKQARVDWLGALQPCSVKGCKRDIRAKGLCAYHYTLQEKGEELRMPRERGRLCKFPGCDRPHVCKGYCQGHYVQKKAGKRLKPLRAYKSSTEAR